MKKTIYIFTVMVAVLFTACNDQLLDSTFESGKNNVKKTAIDPGKYNEDLNRFSLAVSMAIRDNAEFSEVLAHRFLKPIHIKEVLVSQLISEESEQGPYIADILNAYMGYPVQELVNEYPNIRIRIVKDMEQFIAQGYNAAVVYKAYEYQSGDIVEGYINGEEPYHTENIEDNEYFLFIVEEKYVEYFDNYWLKKDFSIALHAAMKDHVEIRTFIKEQALKQFTGDYDVLYNYVKDEEINGTTFRDYLINYVSEEKLTEIEKTIPALTIFVPTLPENSFSAETWNTEEDVPFVAIRLFNYNDVPMISSKEGESFWLDGNVIPAFPVVVVKDNEQIILPQYAGYDNAKGEEHRSFWSHFTFKILDWLKTAYANSIEQKVIDAWNIYGPYNGWQRDYVYYNITPENPNGAFAPMYDERITYLKLMGTGAQALSNICPRGSVSTINPDPQLKQYEVVNYWIWHTPPPFSVSQLWTDGNFDFQILVDLGNGISINRYIMLEPEEVFDIQYKSESAKTYNGLIVLTVYVPTSITPKEVYVNGRLIDWSLEQLSNIWQVEIKENDATETRVENIKGTSKWNMNFELTPSIETGKVKVGAKFGVANEQTKEYSTQYTYSIQSDDLGKFPIFFGDQIIISQSGSSSFPIYNLYKYDTGKIEYIIRPIKRQ